MGKDMVQELSEQLKAANFELSKLRISLEISERECRHLRILLRNAMIDLCGGTTEEQIKPHLPHDASYIGTLELERTEQ